jgi:tRNA pseudouridine55 synthase
MPINGLLLIDKPAGPTSFEVGRRVRKALKVKKAGHLGTLDPMATGLLPLALGEATRLAPFLEGAHKTYLAEVLLGVETDTQDATGAITAHSQALPEAPAVVAAAAGFVGEIEQVPPMYSAVRHQGRRLYQLARRGEQVEVPPRKVIVYRLEVKEIALPRLTLEVACGKGTYIRTLAHDLGRALGCGGHLAALRRLAVGPFAVGAALPLAQVLDDPESARTRVLPLADCLPDLPAVAVESAQARRLAQGQALAWTQNGAAGRQKLRVLLHGRLLAVAELRREPQGVILAPVRVFPRPERF